MISYYLVWYLVTENSNLESDIKDHEIESDNLGIDDYKLESDIEDHEIKMIILWMMKVSLKLIFRILIMKWCW